MLHTLHIFETYCTDPYQNLATERLLLDQVAPGECILYLWQNQNTVVIGRNQNPWAECRTALLEQEGGHLARRLSGGGAVFHDLGNLNFTFLVSQEDYDLDRQLSVIQKACEYAGISAERSGRNDLLAQGCKFSGNAFYQSQGRAYHHGTLLICADMDKLQRYLSPSKAKLAAKGVSSVRSRVINLQALSPTLTCDAMRRHMHRAFEEIYGLPAAPVVLSADEQEKVRSLSEEYGSWDHLYGTPLPFSFACEDRFPWGQLRIELQAKNGLITAAKIYSDSMDWQISAIAESALTGCAFRLADMQQALRNAFEPEVAADIIRLLEQQEL